MTDAALESRVLLAAAFSFDFTTIASNLSTNPSQRFFGSPNASDSPFTIIRYGFGDITSITGLPATSGALTNPGDLSFSFGSDDINNPVEVVTLSSFDNGLGDGLANQIYTPDGNDDPTFTLFNAGVPVATGELLTISLQTTSGFVVTSPSSAPSRLQVTAAVGADTTIFDELMAATGGTGIVEFSLSAFNLTGPWAGVGDAEIFSSTGDSLNLSDPPPPTDDHGDTIGTATAWNRSAAITGEHEAAISDDVDYFAVQLTAGTQYTFRVHDQDEQPEDTVSMFLVDGTEADLANSDPVPGTNSWTNSLTFTAPATATYYIGVFAGLVRGEYSLEQTSAIVISGDDHGNGTTEGDATSWNRAAPIAGNIETSMDKDWFAVTLTAGIEYVFRTNPGTLYDSILELYAADQTSQLEFNDDALDAAFDEYHSRLSFIPDVTGTYYLVVSGYGDSDPFFSEPYRMGSYSLSQVSSVPYRPARPVLDAVDPSVTTNQRPEFTWAAVDHATSYDVFIANITTPNTPVLRQNVAGTSFVPPRDIGIGRWVVSIRAYSAQNVGSFWSAPQNFRINTHAAIGSVPFLASSARPTFTWQPLPGATSYELWIDNISTGEVQVIPNPTPATNSFTPESDLSAGVHRFWVRGISVDGSRGGWSAFADMYVGPTIVAPVNPTFDVRPTFTWTAIAGISTHDIWIQKSWGSGVPIRNVGPIVGNEWTPDVDLESGNYTWWIRGTLTNGQKIAWSLPQTFNVGGQPTLQQPTEIGASTTISWTPVTGAVGYELFVRRYVNTVSDFELQTDEPTNFAVVTTTTAGTYQFWVRAVTSTGGKSRWSNSVHFVIGDIASIPKNQTDHAESLLTVLPAVGELLVDHTDQNLDADAPQPETPEVSERVASADPEEWKDPDYSGPTQGVIEPQQSMPRVTESAAFATAADIVMSEWDALQFGDRKQRASQTLLNERQRS